MKPPFDATDFSNGRIGLTVLDEERAASIANEKLEDWEDCAKSPYARHVEMDTTLTCRYCNAKLALIALPGE